MATRVVNGNFNRTSREALKTGSLVILATLACVAALYLGKELWIPIALALFFNTLLRPIIRRMQKWGMPAPIGASVLVLAMIGLVGGMGALLVPQARNVLGHAPASMHQAKQRWQSLWEPLQQVSNAAAELGKTTDAKDDGSTKVTLTPPQPGMLEGAFGTTAAFAAGIVEVILLLFLLLASGGTFLERLMGTLPTRADKRTAANIVSEVENAVSQYLGVTTLINIGEGILVGLALWALGMPNPALWGAITIGIEFIPYLGGATLVVVLTISAMATFDTLGRALMMPGAYLVISTLQNNVLSPILYGNRLKLNAVAVLLSVLIWWFLWGVVGAFLAVPALAALKILCDHFDSLGSLGKFLEA